MSTVDTSLEVMLLTTCATSSRYEDAYKKLLQVYQGRSHCRRHAGHVQEVPRPIRKDPSAKAKTASTATKKRWNAAKIGLVARQAKVAKTKAEFLAQLEEQKE